MGASGLLQVSLLLLILSITLQHAAAGAQSKQQASVAEAAVPKHSTLEDLQLMDTSFSRLLAKALARSNEEQQRPLTAAVAAVDAADAQQTAAEPAGQYGYHYEPTLKNWLEGLMSDLEEETDPYKHKVYRPHKIEEDDEGRKGFYDSSGHFILVDDKPTGYMPHPDSQHYSPSKDEQYNRQYNGPEQRKPEYQPRDEQYKPADEQYKPHEEQYKPVEEQYTPVEEQYKPREYKHIEEQHKPVEEQYKPREEQYKPADEQYKPRKYKPVEEQYKPREEPHKPAEEQYKHHEEQYKPRKEQNKHDEEQYKHHGEQKRAPRYAVYTDVTEEVCLQEVARSKCSAPMAYPTEDGHVHYT
jgi:hypothetical protein